MWEVEEDREGERRQEVEALERGEDSEDGDPLETPQPPTSII